METPPSLESCARQIMACLGDPSRFRLVSVLASADCCVGELARLVGLSQSCTTRHLQALERMALVERRREGRQVRFRLRLEAPNVGPLLGWLLTPSTGVPATTPMTPEWDDRGQPPADQGAGATARGSRREEASPPEGVRRGAYGSAAGVRGKPATGEPPAEEALSEDEAQRPSVRREQLDDYLL